ncbi:MAG: helix-turn-helix transcriptional regulator [Chloroflexi bacterium]|nr:helix-turn-helix transcriptional regulator [Chloroflexota bacterium]
MHQKMLLKGSTKTLLLAMLSQEPMYGYRLVKEMKNRSSGYFLFKEGTLYPALHRLEKEGLVSGEWNQTPGGQQRRYYFITDRGRHALSYMLEEWQEFSRAVNLVARPRLL